MQRQNQNEFSEETLVRLFILRYAKPLMKEILLEFFKENELMFVSMKEPKHQLLTTDDVAKLLSVDRHTVYQYMKMGLPSFKAGKAHKFRFVDVQTFVRERVTTEAKTSRNKFS